MIDITQEQQFIKKSREHATQKMKASISEWVSFGENNPIKMETVANWLKKETFSVSVEKDKSSTFNDVTTFWHMPASQIPFLEYVHSLEAPNVIELGCSSGRMVWKTLLAGGRVFANDLYGNQVQKMQSFVHEKMPHKESQLTPDFGDALTVIKRHPDIKESFDVVLSQNLIHYLTPNKYIEFIQITYDLLKPGGQLYLTGQHIYSHVSKRYKDYIGQTSDKKLVQNLMKTVVVSDMLDNRNSGHYFLKPLDVHGYTRALEEDKNPLNAFDSSYLRQSLESIGFKIKSYMCLDFAGTKSECYDNLSQAIDKTFRNYDTTCNSQFVSIIAVKPLGEESTDPNHSEL